MIKALTVTQWFLYRRWRLIKWVKEYDSVGLLKTAYRVNLCSCRDYRIIYRDMERILK